MTANIILSLDRRRDRRRQAVEYLDDVDTSVRAIPVVRRAAVPTVRS
jgi:hypothetical protein